MGDSISTLFQSPDSINMEKFKFEPFKTDTTQVEAFDCGNKELNEFLCSEEVSKYQDDIYGNTTLVYYGGELVAYYTLSSGSLRKAYVERTHKFSKIDEYTLEEIPALTIGRLAVQKEWQKKGLGRILLQRISMQALDYSKHAAIRLLLVQSKVDAFDFYTKCGFAFTLETKRERKRFKARGTRTMFFDMTSLNYLRPH